MLASARLITAVFEVSIADGFWDNAMFCEKIQNICAFWNYSIFEDSCSECSSEDENEGGVENFCDTCERAFYSNEQLQKHLEQHRVCGIDGCTFVAHTKVVDKHIEMQHVTGLYYRIKKAETPEDIAKWIAERRRKYPSKENIEKRQKEQEERFKRGERIQKPNDRFGRKNKTVLEKPGKTSRTSTPQVKRLQPPKGPKKTKTPAPSLIMSKENWNGNMPPFMGTAELYEDEIQEEVDIAIDDEEWISEKTENPTITLNNALGALIGAYRSSDESEDEIVVPKNELKVPEFIKNSEDQVEPLEAPEEIKISRVDECKIPQNEPTERHRKRKRQHPRGKNVEPKRMKEEPKPPMNEKAKRRQITLLERLLEPDIRHERNVILQCVRFVVENKFFDQDFLGENAKEEIKEKVEEIEAEEPKDEGKDTEG